MIGRRESCSARRRCHHRALALYAMLAALTASPDPMARDDPEPLRSPFSLDYEAWSLENGLEVILHRDTRLPFVAVNIWYRVGPVNEPEGRSGFAHLFEHLMFEGSKHAGREFDRLLESAGASRVNGTTSWDRTNYFETVPRQYLELALWLESDRMGFMIDALTEERLEVQRDVVKNERRQRYDNAPYGPSDLAMYDLLFPEGHPYHGAIIGSMQDLSSATMEDVRRFFETYYAPGNATLTLVGDFDPTQTRQVVERYFGTLSKRPVPEAIAQPTGPLAKGARKEIAEPVQLARVAKSWRTPAAFTDDDIALEVATGILAGGKATRLYQTLVVEEELCSSVTMWLDSNAVSSVVSIEAMVAKGARPRDVEAALAQVVDGLARGGPTDDELARSKRQIEVSVLSSLQRLDGSSGESGRAGTLQRLNHYLHDPGALAAQMERLRSVTASDVRRAVSKHLGSEAAVVVTIPKAAKERAP